ncbi:MAG TPA: fibronectin type III domain-containing protein [Candidatus Saccharimonadales bacterium]|nr:fibronectin type III domain-containing protein [Candidatus Saccharimonadales bacterium]
MDKKWFNKFARTPAASLLLLLAALSYGPRAEALQTIAVSWNPSAASAVAGYAIYYGNASGQYGFRIDAGTNTSASIPNLTEGETNFFVVKAYTSGGTESTPSNEISYIVPGVVRVAPGNGSQQPAVVSFPVAPGHTYNLQATVDFQSWSTIWQTTGVTNGWVQFADPEAAGMKMRFYRLAMQ